jgi:hypothetical protein
MQTKTLIKDSAEVVRIITLEPGDVYKRLVATPYGDGKHTIRIGIVQDVLSNGEQSAITALEFKPSYASVAPEIVVFAGDEDVALFTATPAEIDTFFAEVEAEAQRQVTATRTALGKAEDIAEAVARARSMSLAAAGSVRGEVEA